MKPALLPCALVLLLGFSISSCKKDDNGGGTCRLATAHIKIPGGYDATTKVTYDTTGRMVGNIVSGSASKVSTFTYKGDTILVKETNGIAITDYKVIRNSNGNIKDLIGYVVNSGAIGFTVHYDYNGSGKVFKQTTTYPLGVPTEYTTNYNAAGDATDAKNPVSSSTGITYQYYTDQPYQTGDAKGVSNILTYGANALTNTHILRSETSQTATGGTLVTTYNYTYGDGGRITHASVLIGTSESTYDYTYDCK